MLGIPTFPQTQEQASQEVFVSKQLQVQKQVNTSYALFEQDWSTREHFRWILAMQNSENSITIDPGGENTGYTKIYDDVTG